MSTKAAKALKKMAGDLTLGKALRAIRLSDEMSQGELAAMLEVTQSYLSDLEHDRKEVSPQKAVAFAEILGHSEKQFIRLAIQDSLRRKGLPYEVEIRDAA